MEQLEQLIKQGVVFRKGVKYYININDDKFELANSKKDSQVMIERLISEGKLNIPATSESSKPSDEVTTEHQEETLDSKDISEEQESPSSEDSEINIDNLLGEIADLQPSASASSLDVLYKGVNVFDLTHPVIRKLGVAFRWRKRQDNGTSDYLIKDGKNNWTCRGWQVFLTDTFKAIHKDLTLLRNDTPNDRFVTNGELILCIAKLEQYNTNQLKKTVEFMKEAKSDREKRTEAGKNFSKYDDHKQAAKKLNAINKNDLSVEQKYKSEIEELAREL